VSGEPSGSPRLERPARAPLGGVCAALARTTGTDPVLWRVGAVVLTVFHGLGIVLYLLGYVLIPAEGEAHSLGQRLVRGPDRRLTGGQVVLLVLLLGGVVALQSSDGLLVVLLLAGLAWLWWHNHDRPGAPAPLSPPVAPGVAVTPPPAVPTRSRSPYGALVASLALLAAAVLVLVGTAGGASVPAEVVVSAALGVVGLGLVAGSFSGSSPGLVVLAFLLGAGLAVTAGVEPFVDRGVGQRTWRPVVSGEYRLGVGHGTLDLRQVSPGDAVVLDAHVEVGQLTVVVPEGLHLVLDAHVDLGEIDLLGATRSGSQVTRRVDLGPGGAPVVRVHADVRLGQVEVRHG
jgi:phage shock protein PspC (stress-responsive transcriptional regulator)